MDLDQLLITRIGKKSHWPYGRFYKSFIINMQRQQLGRRRFVGNPGSSSSHSSVRPGITPIPHALPTRFTSVSIFIATFLTLGGPKHDNKTKQQQQQEGKKKERTFSRKTSAIKAVCWPPPSNDWVIHHNKPASIKRGYVYTIGESLPAHLRAH